MVAIALVLATIAPYAPTLAYPFIFDDRPSIVENDTIRTLWPVSVPLQPPADGSTVTNRPLLNLSFAVNHAIHGLDERGYRVANACIHAGAALLLFGLVRRTLSRVFPAWPAPRAISAASAVALLWALHPLQTESVTYISQRAESLAGMLLFAVLYGFARGTEPTARAPRAWIALCVVLTWLGMAAKETLVTAPLLVFLYDRTFVAGSFRHASAQRWRVHLGLAGAWIVLAALMLGSPTRGDSVGFSAEVGPWTSLLTQSDAVVMYLSRAFWPDPLVFDYGTSVSDHITELAPVAPQLLLLMVLFAGTCLALARRPPLGFLGAAFFLTLAPSSSVVPILSQMRAEHRMYVPLAAIVAFVVIAVLRVAGRWSWVAFAALAGALAVTTAARNRDYASPTVLWADTARKVPANPRAHYNLAHELAASGDAAGAIAAYATAVDLDPEALMPRVNLATLLLAQGRPAEARPHAEAAVRIDPRSAAAHTTLGRVRVELRDLPGALAMFETAVRLRPADAGCRRNLGLALLHLGRVPEALRELTKAAELHPDPDLWLLMARVHQQHGTGAEVRACLDAALVLSPDHPMAHFELGNHLAAAGEFEAAIPHYERAVTRMPEASAPRFNLALALERAGRVAEAIALLEQVTARDPADAEARDRLHVLRGARSGP